MFNKVFILMLLLISLEAFATAEHMISAGSSGTVLVTGEGRKDTQVNLKIGYAYAFSRYFQLGIQNETSYINVNLGGTGGSYWYSFLSPTFTFNIPWGVKQDGRNALYFEIAPGVIFASDYSSNSKLTFNVNGTSFMGRAELGNRFSLGENVSYSPNIGIYVYEGYYDNGLVIDPYLTFLQFDIFF